MGRTTGGARGGIDFQCGWQNFNRRCFRYYLNRIVMIEIISHRGYRENQDLPNSFEALLKAKPGDVIEIDVFRLKDENLAVVHQKDLGLSEDEIENWDLKNFEKFDQPKKNSEEVVEGSKMPLMEEALGIACDRGVKLLIELKSGSKEKIEKLTEILVGKIVQMQKDGAFETEENFLNNLSFMSFSVDGLICAKQELKKNGLTVRTILSWTTSAEFAAMSEITQTSLNLAQNIKEEKDWFEKGIQVAKNNNFTGISLSVKELLGERGKKYIKQAHDKGLLIKAGFPVEDEKDIQRLEKMGVDICLSEKM